MGLILESFVERLILTIRLDADEQEVNFRQFLSFIL